MFMLSLRNRIILTPSSLVVLSSHFKYYKLCGRYHHFPQPTSYQSEYLTKYQPMQWESFKAMGQSLAQTIWWFCLSTPQVYWCWLCWHLVICPSSCEHYCCLHLSTPRSFFSSFFIFLTWNWELAWDSQEVQKHEQKCCLIRNISRTSIFCSTFSLAASRSAAS